MQPSPSIMTHSLKSVQFHVLLETEADTGTDDVEGNTGSDDVEEKGNENPPTEAAKMKLIQSYRLFSSGQLSLIGQ